MNAEPGFRVLVIEDEPDILDLMVLHLEAAGLRTLPALRGEEGVRLAVTERPDLVILDLMLPDLTGFEVLRQLRRHPAAGEVPVMILSARGGETDRIVGYEIGADDYVVKPFSPREVVLRVKALLARTRGAGPSASPDILERGGLRVDRDRHEVHALGAPVDLTRVEYRLLLQLMERPGWVLSRQALLEGIWDGDVRVTHRTVDTHMMRLRAKLGAGSRCLETVRGVGYRFQD